MANYYEKILVSNTKIAVAYIIRSELFKYAHGIFNFAKSFTLTNSIKNGLFGTGSAFGYVLGVILIPVAIIIDIIILVLGVAIAGSMFLLGFLSFPAILIWLLIS